MFKVCLSIHNKDYYFLIRGAKNNVEFLSLPVSNSNNIMTFSEKNVPGRLRLFYIRGRLSKGKKCPTGFDIGPFQGWSPIHPNVVKNIKIIVQVRKGLAYSSLSNL